MEQNATGELSNLQRHLPPLALDWAAKSPGNSWQQLEGTLCFADISGFTALAERLAEHGRVGGEELVDTLGRVFTTMIGIARKRRGSLLKFGGDALLLFFRGPDHAQQAASAAVEMRIALREAARIPTSVGPLRLSMSVGLHSGMPYFFLVGDSHRELVLLGPDADAVVRAESTAAAGEIVVTEATTRQLPRSAVRTREDGALLLRWRKGSVDPIGAWKLPENVERIATGLFPGLLGDFLRAGAPDPEHRVACIAFARFSGTNALLNDRGPEVVAAALDTTLGQIQRVLVEEGVTLLAVDLDEDGGKLFMAAGIPQAHEDDEGVMLRALRRIADLGLPLSLQLGVNRGHVFAAEVGDHQRAAFSAMGDTTNTAARIAAKTPVGRIYAHPSVLDECQTLYEVRQAEPLVLKGKAAPLVVYDVGAEIGLREREGLSVDVLVGRTEELARIRRAGQRLLGGEGGVLSLVGDTGLGKTRLLHEAAIGLKPLLTLRGEPYGANSAYRTLRDPLRALLGIERDEPAAMRASLVASIEDLCPEVLPMLALIGNLVAIPVEPSPEVQALDVQFLPDRTADVLIQLLAAVSGESLCVSVDEAHWCDEATALILSRLEHETERHPWLLLLARRDVAQGYVPVGGERLEIEPMPDEDIRRLVRIATDAAPLLAHELEVVVRRSGGYPLFAEEIVRTSRGMGSMDAVPESLEAAVAAQVDSLDRSARRVLQFAAVLGRSFTVSLLEALLAVEGYTLEPAHLERLGDVLVPEGDDRMQFRSGMLRDTVYEGIAYRLRRRLHRAAGEALEQRSGDAEAVSERLVVHYHRARDLDRTWHFGCIAGRRSEARYANADAARHYETALEAGRKLTTVAVEDRCEVLRSLGEVRAAVGMFDEALDALREALKLSTSSALERAKTLLQMAKVRDRSGAPSSGLRDLSRADALLAELESADGDRLAAEIACFRCNVLFGQDRLEQAMEKAHEAVQLAEENDLPAPLAGSLMIRESARTMLEGPGDGTDLLRALEIYESLEALVPQGTVLTNLGVSVAFEGRWNDAAGYLREARARYERGGNAAEAALAAANIADLLLCQGHISDARALLEEALPTVRAARWTEGECGIRLQLAHAFMEEGEVDRADELLLRTAEDFRTIGQPAGVSEALLLRAAGAILSGDHGTGFDLLHEALAESDGDLGMLSPREALLRAIALGRAGQLPEAINEAERGLDLARQFELTYETGLLSRLSLTLGLAADVLTATEQAELQAAAARLDDLGVVRAPRSFTLESP